ncbi:MAG: antitoxin VapB family protein [Methanothrix sp.]
MKLRHLVRDSDRPELLGFLALQLGIDLLESPHDLLRSTVSLHNAGRPRHRKSDIQVNTRTLLMSTKTITITEEAYERLKSRKGENQSFSEAILHNFPAKRKLSEILDEIGRDDELADRIEVASIEMRQAKLRNVDV